VKATLHLEVIAAVGTGKDVGGLTVEMTLIRGRYSDDCLVLPWSVLVRGMLRWDESRPEPSRQSVLAAMIVANRDYLLIADTASPAGCLKIVTLTVFARLDIFR